MNNIIAQLLGYIMQVLYNLCKNYGISIVLFTVVSKIVLLPISIIIQKNSIKMIKIKPKVERLKIEYSNNKDEFMEKQIELFKQEKYRPFFSIIPLLIQIALVLGLIKVIENPEMYISNLKSIMLYRFNLSDIPTLTENIIIPILAGISALLLCYFQNKANPLQMAESKLSKFFASFATVIITIYFAFLVPIGVALYWICSNLLAIIQMYFLNFLYSPKKYVDYKELEDLKKKRKSIELKIRENKKKERYYYKKFFQEQEKGNIKLIFYSEQNGFYKYFSGIIEYLLKNSDIVIHYITSDAEDSIFQAENERIIPYYIGQNKLIPLFMKIEADMVIMTTPDLQKYYLKRSVVRKDVEYVYLDHGMTSLNLTLRKGAIDYFDTIFANGEEQVKEIREIEKLRGTKEKSIIKVGFPLLDDMIKEYSISNNKIKTIVIAPSHQEDNIMDSCIDDMLKQLLNTNYRIIVRPHPQYIRRNETKIEKLKEKYSGAFNENFILELDFASTKTINEADLVITDWSGIGYEFSFATTKPTLFINTKMKVINPEYDKIETVPLDISIRNIIGKAIEKENINDINKIIDELITNDKNYKELNMKTREKYLFNLGKASEIAGEYIIGKIEK